MTRYAVCGIFICHFFANTSFAQEKLLFQLAPFAGGFHELEFSADGTMVATISGHRDTNVLEVWGLGSKDCIGRLRFGKDGGPCFVKFSPGDKSLQFLLAKVTNAFAGWDLQEFDIKSGEKKTLFSSNSADKPLALWMDKRVVVTAGVIPDQPKVKHSLKLLNIDNNKLHFIPFDEPFEVMAFSPDRKRAVLRSGRTQLKIIDLEGSKKTFELQMSNNMSDKCYTCTILPDNKTLIAMVAGLFPKLQIWDLETAKLTKTVDYRGTSSNRPVASKDGHLFAMFGGGGVFVIETKKFTYVSKIKVSSDVNLDVIRFSPDGSMLLGADHLGHLRTFQLPKLD